MLSRPRRIRVDHSDSGMTLVELLVGLILVTAAADIDLMFFVGSTQQANRVTDQSLDGADARVAIERITAELRLADSPTARPGTAAGRFEVMTATRIVFYANLDPASRIGSNGRIPPTRVDIAVNGTQLVERRYAPISNYATAPTSPPTPAPTPYPSPYDYTANYPAASNPTSQAILVNGLQNTTDVFSYCSSASEPSVNCTVTTDPTAIASVGVTLTVQPKRDNRAQAVQTIVAITGATS